MPKVFVSYARADREIVQALIHELQELGHDAFYDQKLSGGQRWWDVLLDQIQSADVFLPVLTSEYRRSEACHREAMWAESVNVPFVPIDLGQASPDLFEKVIAEANWVHYSLDDRASIARLARALAAMPKPDKPIPPPPRPPIPISYFAELEREIRIAPTISLERQFAIIAALRAKLNTREDGSARIMLDELRDRTDITYSNAVDIERMLASPVQVEQQFGSPTDTRSRRGHAADQPQPPAHQQGPAYQQGGGYQPKVPQEVSYLPPPTGINEGPGPPTGAGSGWQLPVGRRPWWRRNIMFVVAVMVLGIAGGTALALLTSRGAARDSGHGTNNLSGRTSPGATHVSGRTGSVSATTGSSSGDPYKVFVATANLICTRFRPKLTKDLNSGSSALLQDSKDLIRALKQLGTPTSGSSVWQLAIEDWEQAVSFLIEFGTQDWQINISAGAQQFAHMGIQACGSYVTFSE